MQGSCLTSGDSVLWRGTWRRPVPSSRLVRTIGASCVRWGGSGRRLCALEVDMESEWMVMCCAVDVGWEMWGEDRRCELQGLMRKVVRLARVTTCGKASEHQGATWVNTLLCAR